MWANILRVNFAAWALYFISAVITIITIRLSACLPQYREGLKQKSKKSDSVSTLVFWGSGGHTTEMIRLISNLPRDKYFPMYFVKSHSDTTSEDKILAAKLPSQSQVIWRSVYRSREVRQSWLSTIFTSVYCLIECFLVVLKTKPLLILCNGPGTGVLICYSAFLLRMLGVYQPVIVYTESFCRVKSLSLSGKLIYPIADKFIVQWPELALKYSRSEYLGRICWWMCTWLQWPGSSSMWTNLAWEHLYRMWINPADWDPQCGFSWPDYIVIDRAPCHSEALSTCITIAVEKALLSCHESTRKGIIVHCVPPSQVWAGTL